MKLKTAVFLAGLGVSGSTLGAFALPVSPGYVATPEAPVAAAASSPQALSRFSDGQTLMVDARLGHASVAKGAGGETYLFANVTGADAPGSAPPLNLAIAIDRSGSMRGDRIANAIAAATGIVDRMRDGDTISVISFDTAADAVVSPTVVSASSRATIEAKIRAIRLGGDTCISCGLERAETELSRASFQGDHVSRIILLSDGVTNHGITDMGGMRSMSARIRDRGIAVSTIGVDVDFDEKMMATIAQESNGRHYFVSSPQGLPAIFAQEFDSLLASVARDAEMRIDLAPGVAVDQVFDRSFRREGSTVVVPFGTFGSKQEKTVLIKLRVPADRDGASQVAHVSLGYRDLVKRGDGRCGGDLGLLVVSDGSAQKDLDPFVETRLERSRTAQALTDANLLFKEGRVDEAREKLETQKAELGQRRIVATRGAATTANPMMHMSVDDDFEKQTAAIDLADKNFAPPASAAGGAVMPAPAQEQGRVQVRVNQASASEMSF